MRKYRSYTDQTFSDAVKQVTSIAGLLRVLGLKEAGGNYALAKRRLQYLKLDTSHWTGQAWSKDQQLKDWTDYTRVKNFKPHLIKKFGNKCFECKLDKWLGKDIPLEVHHKDGDRCNNKLENLQLLCCNCHAL